MADVTPTTRGMAGVLVPYAAAQIGSVLGTDYDVADAQVGPCTPTTATGLSLEATGSLPATVTQREYVVARPGFPGAGESGAGVVYRDTVGGVAGAWHGADGAWWPMGYSALTTGTVDDHVVLLGPSEVQGGPRYEYHVVRDAASVDLYAVGEDGTVAVAGSTGLASSRMGACIGPDGAVYAVTASPHPGRPLSDLYLRTSRWGGEPPDTPAFISQSLDGAGGVVGSATRTVDRLRVATDAQGGMVAFLTWTDTSGTTTYGVSQYASTDAGATWQLVDEISATTGVRAVLDVRLVSGLLLIVSVESGIDVRVRAIGVATQAYSASTARATLETTVSNGTAPRALCADDTGRVWYWYPDSTTGRLGARYSDDVGVTWSSAAGLYAATYSGVPRNAGPGRISAAWVNGRLVMLGDGTGGTGPGTQRGALVWRYGGVSSYPLTIDFRSADGAYHPIDTLANQGYTAAGASVTRTPNASTGTAIVATSTGSDTYTTSSYLGSSGYAYGSLRVTAGTATVLLRVSDGASGHREIRMDLTSTQIGFSGAAGVAPTMGAHNVSGFIQWWMSLDSASGTARAGWRAADDATVRTWTVVTITPIGVVGTTGDMRLRYEYALGTTCAIYESVIGPWVATIGGTQQAAITAAGLSSSALYTYDPIRLGPVSAYGGAGARLQRRAGLAVIEGTTVAHVAQPISPYSLDRVLPGVDPSPRSVWRSDLTAQQDVTIDIQGDRPGVLGVLVSGLDGVGLLAWQIGINGTTPSSAPGPAGYSPSIGWRYDTVGASSAIGAASGADQARQWVRADALRGWYLADGTDTTVHRIVGNTEGHLGYGATIAGQRAVIYTESALSTATGRTGILLPPAVLWLYAPSAGVSITSITLRLSAQATYTWVDSTHREVGLVAVGRVHLLELPPDLSRVVTIESEASVETQADGTRTSARTAPDRSTMSFGWQGSWHEVRQVIGEVTPDYVGVSGANPGGTAAGIPYAIDGLMRALGGEPGALIPDVPTDDLTPDTWTPLIPVRGDEWIWGRVLDDYRREGEPYIGVAGRTDTFRVPALRVEEET